MFFSNWIFSTVFILSLGAYYWEENRVIYCVIKFGKHVVPVIAVLFWEIVGVDIILGIVMVVKLLKS